METVKQDSAAPTAPALKEERPRRAKLTEEETLKRMELFDERKEQFVAAVLEGTG